MYLREAEAGGRTRRTRFLALPLLSGDDGFQILALPPFLAPIAVLRGCLRLLRLVDHSLLDVCCAVHVAAGNHSSAMPGRGAEGSNRR